MAFLDDIRKSLRLTTDSLDDEAQMLIDAALYDMERAGVNPALLEVDGNGDIENAFVRHAVTAYCKAHFGYDVPEASRFDDSYRRIVCDLLNSSENIAAIEPSEEGPSEDLPGEPADDPSEGESNDGGEGGE